MRPLAPRLVRALSLAAALAAAAVTGPAGAQSAAERIEATVDKNAVLLGEPVTFTIRVNRDPKDELKLPGELKFGKLELLDRKSKTEEGKTGLVVETHTFQLASYELGEVKLPSLQLMYRHASGQEEQFDTGEIVLQVSGRIQQGQAKEELRGDGKPVVAIERWYTPAWVAGGLLLAALLGALAWWIKKKLDARLVEDLPEPELPPRPPRPAHEVALEKLRGLAQKGLDTSGEYKLFHYEVSEIVREYLGGRYGFDGLEMTSTEVSFKLRSMVLPGLDVPWVDAYLARCDFVKFAKGHASADDCRHRLEEAVALVERTRPREIGAGAAEATPAAAASTPPAAAPPASPGGGAA